MVPEPIPLGELISALYANYLALYGDGELAALATASAINDMLDQGKFLVEHESDGLTPVLH